MKCQKCQKEATYHITEIIKGKAVEIHLCDYHGHEYLMASGADSEQTDKMVSLLAQQMNHHVVMNQAKEKINELDADVCPVCGASFYDFRNNSRLGCPSDYDYFSEQLLPLLANIHAATEHVGRRPPYDGQKSSQFTRKYGLKRQMLEAVAEENYELASELRDKIRAIH